MKIKSILIVILFIVSCGKDNHVIDYSYSDLYMFDNPKDTIVSKKADAQIEYTGSIYKITNRYKDCEKVEIIAIEDKCELTEGVHFEILDSKFVFDDSKEHENKSFKILFYPNKISGTKKKIALELKYYSKKQEEEGADRRYDKGNLVIVIE